MPLHNGSYEHRVSKIQDLIFFCTRDVHSLICLFICVINIVIGDLDRPYSTHTAPMPVLTGSVHAHKLTKPSRAGFAVIRLELIEPGAATCAYQAKACSPTDQPVRKFKDGLGIHMTMKTFFTSTFYIMLES